MKVIGITGRAGCGKSLLSRLLLEKGAKVIELDGLGHEALEESIEDLRGIFGDSVASNGKIDRKKLGEIVFTNKDQLCKLNNLIHPLIKAKVEYLLRDTGKKLVVVDGALIHQIGLAELCDYIVWVECPENLAKERLQKRGMSSIKAEQVIQTQKFLESYKKKCNVVLYNISTPKALLKEFCKVLTSWEVVL